MLFQFIPGIQSCSVITSAAGDAVANPGGDTIGLSAFGDVVGINAAGVVNKGGLASKAVIRPSNSNGTPRNKAYDAPANNSAR